MSMNGPNFARRVAELRGVWTSTSTRFPAAYFSLTRLSEDGKYAYGWHCDAQGKLICGDNPSLAKLEMNARGTAPKGFRR